MSDQPKPATGEWTAATVANCLNNRLDAAQRIADAHNAALDHAVAVERENARQAGQANIRTNEMLTAVRRERDENQKQLAAERDKWIKLCDKTSDNATKAEQALAAEREKVQTLVKALQEIANGSEASADSLRRYAANEIARFNQNTGLDWIGRGDQ